jgi:hypothetical protein
MPLAPRVQQSAEVCVTVWLSETNCEQRSEDQRPKQAQGVQRSAGPFQYELLESW